MIKQTHGFSLVEVTMALGVAVFCLLTLLALLPVGLNLNSAATRETTAMNIASAIIVDVQTTGTNAQSSLFKIQIPAIDATSSQIAFYVTDSGMLTGAPTGGQSLPPPVDARFLVTLTMTPPGAATLQSTQLDIRISWPAMVTMDKALGSIETFAAINR